VDASQQPADGVRGVVDVMCGVGWMPGWMDAAVQPAMTEVDRVIMANSASHKFHSIQADRTKQALQ